MGTITPEFYSQCLHTEVYQSRKGKLFFFKRLDDSARAVLFIRKVQRYYRTSFWHVLSVYYRKKLVRDYGIFIHPQSKIGLGLKLPHPDGIVIGYAVEIGDYVTIYQQVTCGSSQQGDWMKGGQPRIEKKCVLFSGVKCIGSIIVGEGTTVGANAVLNKSTKPHSIWAGIPAKCIGSCIANKV